MRAGYDNFLHLLLILYRQDLRFTKQAPTDA